MTSEPICVWCHGRVREAHRPVRYGTTWYHPLCHRTVRIIGEHRRTA